jgi:Transcriptional regulator, AbiEi antitoxin
MPRPAQRLVDVAEEQWGLVTRQQARAAGVAPTSLARLLDDGRLERVAHGVYRTRGAVDTDHRGLRAAWLRLDPATPAWARLDDPNVAVVSHASAADLHGVGDLRADVHEFTLPIRRQTRRPDVRIHRGHVPGEDQILLRGLPVTRAGRMIGDLLADHVDPSAIGQIAVEVIDRVLDDPSVIAQRIAPYAASYGLGRGDGRALLDHLVALADFGHRSRPLAGPRDR